jgi:hypothetical protein
VVIRVPDYPIKQPEPPIPGHSDPTTYSELIN